jgi:hypothetical protein
MRKLLFDYYLYSHPEIGNFQGVTTTDPAHPPAGKDVMMIDVDWRHEDHVWFEDRWMVASLCDE